MKKGNTFFRKFSQVFAALLIVPVLSFVAASCSDDDDDQPDPNEISDLTGTVALVAGESENTATLKFTAKTSWEADYTDNTSEWFSFSPKSGAAGNITITVIAPYNDGVAKTGKLTIKHGTKTYSVTVKQAAGQPDLAQWDPTTLNVVEQFGQDPYNATEEHPVELTFTVTTKQDYTTLEDAPFKILAFYTDANLTYKAKDSLINWVEFKVAENSPVAKDGKKITLTVKPHDEFGQVPSESGQSMIPVMPNRYAFITIVPKDTEVKDMFTNGELKEEYKGYAIEQLAYKVTYSGNNMLTIGMPTMGVDNFDIMSMNFKKIDFGFYVLTDINFATPLTWLSYTLTNNHVVVDSESGHMGGQAAMVTRVYRGENLPSLQLKHVMTINVVIMKP